MVISFYGITITTEYDALSRMGIDDPKGYIEKRYTTGGKVTLLVTCAVGEAVITQVEAAVEEAQSSGSWVDIMVRTVTCVLGCVNNLSASLGSDSRCYC